MMFTAHCTHCDKTQLIFPSMFKGLVERDGESFVDYTCWCGSEQSTVCGEKHRIPTAA